MKQTHAVPMRWRTAALLAAVSLVGVAAFFWPFIVDPESLAADHATDAPWFFALLLPMVLAVLMADISAGGLDAKGVAMLAVLAAVATAVRPLGAGVAGHIVFKAGLQGAQQFLAPGGGQGAGACHGWGPPFYCVGAGLD